MKSTKKPGWENATLGGGFSVLRPVQPPAFDFPHNRSSGPGFGQICYSKQSPTPILGSDRGGHVAPRVIQLKAQRRF
jgi:hypothetical protein